MHAVEHPLTFPCEGETLVGVLAIPERVRRLGFVILPGGPNYRAGAHRQFVHLARRLADAGIATLRFDYRGMGDSAGAPAGFANVAPDIAAALDAFQSRCPAVVCFALCGLCEGASSALIYHADSHDRRVAALALLNPWVRSETMLAKTFVRHYYARRIASRAFWSRLLRGGVDVSAALRGAAGNARTALGRHSRLSAPESSFRSRMAEGLRAFPGPVFVALSTNDLTAREFAAYAESDERWRGLLGRESVTRFEVADADHTFSSSRARAEFEARMLAWVASLSPLTGECGESSLPADHGARTVLAMPATTGEAKSCP